MTGEVLPGLDVHQCRGFANLGRPQQERGENHRPPQHEVAADRLVFHQLGGQFFVIFEVFRGFGRRGSGSVTSSDRRHLAPGGVPSLGGRGARGSGAGGGRGPSQGGDPIPFRVGRLGSFGRCHAECSQNRGGRPPVRPNSRVGPGGAGGPEEPARSEEGSGAGTSDSTQFPPEMWETPPATRCYGDDQTRVKPTDHPGRRSEVPFCPQKKRIQPNLRRCPGERWASAQWWTRGPTSPARHAARAGKSPLAKRVELRGNRRATRASFSRGPLPPAS